MAKKESSGHDNVRGTTRGSAIPEILREPGFEVRNPPDTIHHSTGLAKGKAGMRFVHPPLAPSQKETSEASHEIKHRAVTGAKGMPTGA